MGLGCLMVVGSHSACTFFSGPSFFVFGLLCERGAK